MKITNKIRHILHRTIENKKDEYTKAQMKVAMMEVIDTQGELNRITDEESMELSRFVNSIINEFYGSEAKRNSS